MTESDSFHVFDESAENVISISSYIETVGLFSNRPLSKGLYRPSDNDGVLTCVDSLFICGLCWNPPQNQLNLANSWYQALDAYTCWDYNESITPSGSYCIKHEALETILTVWSSLTGFSWLSLLLHDWISIMGFIIIMRI